MRMLAGAIPDPNPLVGRGRDLLAEATIYAHNRTGSRRRRLRLPRWSQVFGLFRRSLVASTANATSYRSAMIPVANHDWRNPTEPLPNRAWRATLAH